MREDAWVLLLGLWDLGLGSRTAFAFPVSRFGFSGVLIDENESPIGPIHVQPITTMCCDIMGPYGLSRTVYHLLLRLERRR